MRAPTAPALLLLAVALTGCTGAADDRAVPAPTVDPRTPAGGPGPAPSGTVEVPADDVWAFAQLVPAADVVVTSAVRRPDPADLPSYRLAATASRAAADDLCAQLGGGTPTQASALVPEQLAGWGLTEAPEGELTTCASADPIVLSVQREVLVAGADGGADGGVTLWLSAYDTPTG